MAKFMTGRKRILFVSLCSDLYCTVLPAKSDSDIMFCLQLLSKTLACTLHLSYCES